MSKMPTYRQCPDIARIGPRHRSRHVRGVAGGGLPCWGHDAVVDLAGPSGGMARLTEPCSHGRYIMFLPKNPCPNVTCLKTRASLKRKLRKAEVERQFEAIPAFSFKASECPTNDHDLVVCHCSSHSLTCRWFRVSKL